MKCQGVIPFPSEFGCVIYGRTTEMTRVVLLVFFETNQKGLPSKADRAIFARVESIKSPSCIRSTLASNPEAPGRQRPTFTENHWVTTEHPPNLGNSPHT